MKFPSIDTYITENDVTISGNQYSRQQQRIPDLISEYGSGILAGLKSRKHTMHRMAGCLLEAQKSASSIRKKPV